MKLFRVMCSVAVLGSALAFGGSAQAQQLVCATAPGGAGQLRTGDFTNCRLTVGGQTRTFDIHVPQAYTTNPTATFPLVVDLPGFTNTKVQQAAGSGFKPLSDQRGYIYVAAQGLGNSFNAMGSCCGTQATTDNEIRFLTQIVTTISRNGRINPARVFATGFSNGGSMANTLACGTPQVPNTVFRGIGTVSFPLSGGAATAIRNACASPRTRTLPVIAFHGTNDNVINFNGGANGGLVRDTLAARASNLAWGQIQGCNVQTIRRTTISNTIACEAYSGCRGGTSVQLCTVTGGAHTNRVAPIQNGTTQSARTIYDFWLANPSSL